MVAFSAPLGSQKLRIVESACPRYPSFVILVKAMDPTIGAWDPTVRAPGLPQGKGLSDAYECLHARVRQNLCAHLGPNPLRDGIGSGTLRVPGRKQIQTNYGYAN